MSEVEAKGVVGRGPGRRRSCVTHAQGPDCGRRPLPTQFSAAAQMRAPLASEPLGGPGSLVVRPGMPLPELLAAVESDGALNEGGRAFLRDTLAGPAAEVARCRTAAA